MADDVDEHDGEDAHREHGEANSGAASDVHVVSREASHQLFTPVGRRYGALRKTRA